jgi:hypothetical protein
MSQENPTNVNSPALKPGTRTTEFWGAMIVQLIGVLVLIGLIPNGEAEHLKEAALGVMGGVMAIYVFVRGQVKARSVAPLLLALCIGLGACTPAFAQAPALNAPNEPATVIFPEPAESTFATLEWIVISQSPIADAAAFVDLNWGTLNDVRPAPLPVEIEALGGATYALRIQVGAHPYFRSAWQFFPPIAMKTTQSWFLRVRNADGELVTNELFLLVLPREQGLRFQLSR